jgi:hypothetical protein
MRGCSIRHRENTLCIGFGRLKGGLRLLKQGHLHLQLGSLTQSLLLECFLLKDLVVSISVYVLLSAHFLFFCSGSLFLFKLSAKLFNLLRVIVCGEVLAEERVLELVRVL